MKFQDAVADSTAVSTADSAAVSTVVSTVDSTVDSAVDSAQAATQLQSPDTLLLDSTQVAGDVVGEFSREVSETGILLISGQWEQVITTLYSGLARIAVDFIPRLVSAIFVLLLFYLLYRILRNLISRILSRSKYVDAGLEGLLIKTYGVVAWVFISIMVLAQFGINVTALLAGLSIVGIAVGFAAQDTVQNFISGITILIDRPFRVGHYIEVDSTFGIVQEITLRSTRVKTLNNEMMVMPNTQMINQKLLNYTQLGHLRIDIPFGIAYKEYSTVAREVVLKLTEDDDRIHPAYPPEVVVTGLGASSVDLELRLFIRDASMASAMKCEYTEAIREACRKADLEIPFPHLQLYIDEAKAFTSARFMLPEGKGDQ